MSEEKKKPAEAEQTSVAAAPETPEEAVEKIEGLEADVKQTAACKMEIKVRVPAAAIAKECEKAYVELIPNSAIPGFHKGHAPRKLVERHYETAVMEDVRRMLVARSWEQVTKEHKIHAVTEPELTDEMIKYDKEKGLSYELSLEVAPQFEIKEYKGLELTEAAGDVTDEEVTKTLDGLRKRNAVLEPVAKGVTKEDDVPVVDCDIKVAGAVIQTVSEQDFTLGPDNWLRGLDENFWKDLLGKKAGESATKTVKLPEGYQKEEFRGKDAEVTVTIKDVKRPKLPELNDEFAKDMLYASLDELKKEVRERMQANKKREGRAELARQVEEKLLTMADFALPEELVKSMAENAANRQKMQLAYQGVSRDQIEKVGPQIAEGAQKKTERDVRLYFILQQIAEKEKIEVSENEVERRINMMAQMENQKPARFREELRSQGRLGLVRAEIRDEKTMDKLISLAQLKKAEEKPAEKAEEKTGAKKAHKAEKAEKAEKPEKAEKKAEAPAKKSGGKKKDSGKAKGAE